jgi:hypothetical protein
MEEIKSNTFFICLALFKTQSLFLACYTGIWEKSQNFFVPHRNEGNMWEANQGKRWKRTTAMRHRTSRGRHFKQLDSSYTGWQSSWWSHRTQLTKEIYAVPRDHTNMRWPIYRSPQSHRCERWLHNRQDRTKSDPWARTMFLGQTCLQFLISTYLSNKHSCTQDSRMSMDNVY